MVSFPPATSPAYYSRVNVGQPRGVFYLGGVAPFFTLVASGATAYTVRDYWGNVISSGSVSGTTVTPAAPTGGWKLGWYRCYGTGPNTDSVFGPAYFSTSFVVINDDARFPHITDPYSPFTGGANDFLDIPLKGALGVGTSRFAIDDASNPTKTTADISVAQSLAVLGSTKYWNVPSGNGYYDPTRTRYTWIAFPNGSCDAVTSGDLRIYCKTAAVDGATVTVTVASGTSSGYKITITAATTEVYDNLSGARAAVTALQASSYVVGFGGTNSNLPVLGTTVIGNAYSNGVKATVAALYPYGVRYFEGPSNESDLRQGAEVAHRMMLFQAAVRSGNASAKTLGPCPVDINPSNFDAFLAAGGGNYCDEISFHAYNAQTQGDINLGRTQIAAFYAVLAKYGLSNVPLWQTESTQAMVNVYGIYHPRRSRIPMMQTLQWEQYGIPRERNAEWYDLSHGFWNFPTWLENTDGTLQPYACFYRTLAEETFGYVHAAALSFGTYGDRIWIGSLFTAPAGNSVAIIQMTSYMPNATVTLSVSGATQVSVIDAFGNASLINVVNGLAVIPTSEISTYIRLPAGVTVSVYTCNDWPPVSQQGAWVNSAYGYPVTENGTLIPNGDTIDGKWMFSYGGANGGMSQGTTIPDTITITWPTVTRLDRALIWAGIPWQPYSTLTDFDVQTSADGATWTTQATYTSPIVTTPSTGSFQFGADSTGTGCTRETYWDEQYVFDLKFAHGPVACKAIRLNIRATSYGGEPDAACMAVGGQGNSNQLVTMQEIVTLCDDNVNLRYPTLH